MTIAPETRSDAQEDLSSAMRAGSAAEHERAEGSAFMSALLDGRMSAAGYVAYLQRLRSVYAALESTAQALTDDPIAGAVIDPVLDRLSALDADLAFWAPDGAAPVDSPAARSYADRIVGESAAFSGAFVAHHYTRYLGDLSGGQAIGRILDRTFDLDGAGIAFYAFDIDKVKPYKDRYRQRLDEVGARLTATQRTRVVDEVRRAFDCNQALFAELSDLYC